MKLATFLQGKQNAVGAVDVVGGRILDLAQAAARAGEDHSAFASMLSLIDGGTHALDRACALVERCSGDDQNWLPLASVRLISPLPEPRQMRDFSVFPGHLAGAPAGMQMLAARMAGRKPERIPPVEIAEIFRKQPIYYKCNRLSVNGHDHDVLWPRYSQFMDYELELAVVIGKSGADISVADARNHIFGYTIFNDFSARDAQMPEMASRFGPAKGKDFDTGNVIGPWIVTADEMGDPYTVAMAARVNGEVWSQGSSKGMLHSFEDMMAYVSRDETLHAGEILGSGTIGGGCGMEQDRYLQHGDVVELEIERIGTLRNRVLRKDNATGVP